MDKELLSLYESAQAFGKDSISVELRCNPISARFLSMSWVPALTKEAVAKDPELRNAYRDIMQAVPKEEVRLQRSLNTAEAAQIMYQLAMDLIDSQIVEDENGHKLQSTLIAQVLVECDEVFRVTDTETGRVLQGEADGKPRVVSHAVRLERVQTAYLTDGNNYSARIELGEWKITDWDDLLHGNVWYM